MLRYLTQQLGVSEDAKNTWYRHWTENGLLAVERRLSPSSQKQALNALVFECLAERTIALAQLRRQREPGHGYDPLLQARPPRAS